MSAEGDVIEEFGGYALLMAKEIVRLRAAPPTPPALDAVSDLEEVAIFLEALGSIPGTYAYAPTNECREHAATLRVFLAASRAPGGRAT